MIDPLRHIRRLITALTISGALNIVLIALLFYWNVKERPPTPYFELKPANRLEQQSPLAIDHCNSEVIRCFKKMPLEWLVARLNNTQLVENGYMQRDLALACLVAFHNFNIEKALFGLPQPKQKRTIIYGKFRDGTQAELVVYPGLLDNYFETILNFAAIEKWPLTSKGLFLALRKENPKEHDLSLTDAFFMTPEFTAVETLFSRGEVKVDKEELLTVLLQGDWQLLSTFIEQQRVSQDLSAARRQRFLLDYVEQESKAAAYLMLKTDKEVVAHKIDDHHVKLILQLIDVKTPEAEYLALELLKSPRADVIWKMAATRLYEFAGEAVPENDQHLAALSRFVPHHSMLQAAEMKPVVISAAPPIPPPPKPKPAPIIATKVPKKLTPVTSLINKPVLTPATNKLTPSPKKDKLYIVQEGDSLWKISRRFNVDVEKIKAYNKLDTDVLSTGKPIRIP